MEEKALIGILGGSGLYQMDGLEDVKEVEISTPFGKPSSPIVIGTLEDKRVAFLARHGTGHTLSPTEVNYRANIYAMKSLGVKWLVSISACGSLREDYAPGDLVVPDQLFDFTKDRARSFFEDGLVAHISVADPFCIDLSEKIYQSIKKTEGHVHKGGTFITIEGPRFSTRGESNTFRSWGMSIIGMTTSPEAYLAREAEMCYGVMAHVTDYDVWHVSEEPVTVDMVIKTMQKNTKTAERAIRELIKDINIDDTCEHHNALEAAWITPPDSVSEDIKQKLDLLIGKYYQK